MASHGRPSSTTMTLLSSPIIPGRRSCVNAGPGWKISTTHSTGSKQRFIGNGPQCRSKARNAPQEVSGPILIITLQDLLHHLLHQLPTFNALGISFHTASGPSWERGRNHHDATRLCTKRLNIGRLHWWSCTKSNDSP